MDTDGNENPASDYLFVYGTLRSPLSLLSKDQIAKHVEWLGFSLVQGSLYDIGEYPGAVPSADEFAYINGEIIKMKDPDKILKMLDEYEGFDPENAGQSEFLRKKEPVKLEDGTMIESWVYWYNLPVHEKAKIEETDYLEYLKKKQLASKL